MQPPITGTFLRNLSRVCGILPLRVVAPIWRETRNTSTYVTNWKIYWGRLLRRSPSHLLLQMSLRQTSSFIPPLMRKLKIILKRKIQVRCKKRHLKAKLSLFPDFPFICFLGHNVKHKLVKRYLFCMHPGSLGCWWRTPSPEEYSLFLPPVCELFQTQR